jgi:hypothetical protein
MISRAKKEVFYASARVMRVKNFVVEFLADSRYI